MLTPIQKIARLCPGAIVIDGFEEAIVGFALNSGQTEMVAVYDSKKCIDILVKRDGMTNEEASIWMMENVSGAMPRSPLAPILFCPFTESQGESDAIAAGAKYGH